MDEFYDLREDPGERNNRIGDPGLRSLVQSCADLLGQEVERLQDPIMKGGRFAVRPGSWIEDGKPGC